MSAITDRLAEVCPYWEAYWRGDVPMLCAVLPKDPANPVPEPALGITWLREKIDALGKGRILGGTVRDFERWYETHTAPCQYWNIRSDSPANVAACVNNLRNAM